MSKIADWIIPSHYRELNLSQGQREAAHRISEARKRTRVTTFGPRRRGLGDELLIVVAGSGRVATAEPGKTDFRMRPVSTRLIVHDF